VTNYLIIREQKMGKNVKGNGHGFTWGNILKFLPGKP
jgi:hypothetical protein